MREVLRLPVYRRLLTAYTLNELGWGIVSLTLAVLVYRATGSAVGAMAYFLCEQFVPALISPAIVGAIGERSPRTLLPALYVVQAIALLGLAWLATSFSLAGVLGLTFLVGAAGLVARAIARAAGVSATAPAGLLREGNALMNGAFSVCFMAGPALAGAIVAAGGTALALRVDAAMFAAIALTLATAPGLGSARDPEDPREPGGRLRAALAHVGERPAVRRLLALQAAGVVFFTVSIPVDVVLVEHTLHGGAEAYGALLAVWGAGAIVGSLGYARWRGLPARVLIAAGAAAMGGGFIVMAAAPTLGVALAGSALGGAGNGVWAVAVRTALQERVESTWMALVMSLMESIFQGAPGAGIALGGGLAALGGARLALGVAGAGTLAVAGVTVRAMAGIEVDTRVPAEAAAEVEPSR